MAPAALMHATAAVGGGLPLYKGTHPHFNNRAGLNEGKQMTIPLKVLFGFKNVEHTRVCSLV